MAIRNNTPVLAALVAAFLIGAGGVAAGDGTSDGKPSESSKRELPEPVAELVDALSDVERVEALEDDTFAVHRRMKITGSRLPQNVTIRVNEKGEVVDWGDRPMLTRTYTREDLYRTGHADVAEGLSNLDPAVRPR
jgi:hypothetical protein